MIHGQQNIKNKTLILVNYLMKFTAVPTLCHKTFCLLSTKLLLFFNLILISQMTKLNLKAENIQPKRSTFICFSAHNAFRIGGNYTDKAQKSKYLDVCQNTVVLLTLKQQLTLYMYTCLSHVLGKRNILTP
jgi:hypothetical protein